MFTFSPDIEERILPALQQIFSTELPQYINVPTDPLALKVLHPLPLQDDPTLSAPYLVYGTDYEKGTRPLKKEEQAEYGYIEIGGPLRFLRFYTATCGTSIVTTREQCYAEISNLTTRVMQVLIKHFDLSHILDDGALYSADRSTWIEGANPLLIDLCQSRVKGGETTWFGEGVLSWHYPVSWYPSYH